MADAVAPSLAARCIDPSLSRLVVERGRVWAFRQEPTAERVPLGRARAPLTRRARRWLASQFRPLDVSSKLLLAGALGVLAILLADTLLGALLGEAPFDALYAAVKTVVAVGPNPAIEAGPGAARAASAVSMLAASVLFVTFTAGLVNRLLDRRLTGIVGPRTIPRRDHVVVVGLGQVGLRLCTTLREAGVPVLAVERNRDAHNVRHAKELGIPVVIGSGGDRFLLQRLALPGARALAAVTSDDHENVAICVAARAVAPKLSLVLRAGDGSVTAETRSLFAIGVVCDVLRLAAARLAHAALGECESAAMSCARQGTPEDSPSAGRTQRHARTVDPGERAG